MPGARIRGGAGRCAKHRQSSMLFADAFDWGPSPAVWCDRSGSNTYSMQKPKKPRRILEGKAAGISGLLCPPARGPSFKLNERQRTLHEVDDVIDQLANQPCRKLTPQARKAAGIGTMRQTLRRTEGSAICRRWRAAEGREARRGQEV